MKSQLNPQRLARSAAATLATALLAAPAAHAWPAPERIDRYDYVPAPITAPATVEPTDQGFDWGAAGIGAGVTVGIVVLMAGGVRVRPRAGAGARQAG